MKIRQCLLLGCNHCGYWTGWVSHRMDASRPPMEKVDTICSVCHRRVRFTRGSYTMQGYPLGSGKHNRVKSIFAWRPWLNPETVKSEAAKMNRKLKLVEKDLAERKFLPNTNRDNIHEFS